MKLYQISWILKTVDELLRLLLPTTVIYLYLNCFQNFLIKLFNLIKYLSA